MPGQYEKPVAKKDEESKEELYYRLLVQLLIKLEMRVENDPSFQLREVLSKEVIAWWRKEKADERSAMVLEAKMKSDARKIAALKSKLSSEEMELVKAQLLQEVAEEMVASKESE